MSNFGQLQLLKEYLRVIGWVGDSLSSNFKRERDRDHFGLKNIFTKIMKGKAFFSDAFPCTEFDSINNTRLLVHVLRAC